MIEHTSGSPAPLGLSKTKDGWNLALYSAHAERVSVGIFAPNNQKPKAIIPLEQSADIWHIALRNIPPDALYAFQCEGAKEDGFDPTRWLTDPYAKILASSPTWGHSHAPFKAPFFTPPPFDWHETSPPNIPKQDLIIYEMHVRGFTIDPSSQTKAPGTYRGIIEKIPYLKQLGVNAIELLPIFEFDETSKAPLVNYWGYNPLSFFALKRSYATQEAIQEFKEMVRELHKNKIEVILDVVYNHTGEGKKEEPAISWKGIDNQTYYFVDRNGEYRDFSGCYNTINANHPIVRELILASLRFWAEEMHVDGFRFDLASILTRGPDTHPMDHPPLLLDIQNDPSLKDKKLIAEAWDAVGLYQVGTFPKWGAWSEWNGRYRDIVRRFIKGTPGKAGSFASALCGSEFIYHGAHTPAASINFITAHDGYSLRDLVSYEEKHNWDNGEQNLDGNPLNDSWNCGVEGPTNDSAILSLRERQMRNFFLTLFLSQGIPMLLMGDEYGHTRKGNNNPYVQDNELNWFLWKEWKERADIFEFVQELIAFRKRHTCFHFNRFLNDEDIQWHGKEPYKADWSAHSHFVAYSLKPFYIAFHSGEHPLEVTLPSSDYQLIVNTFDGWKKRYFNEAGPKLKNQIIMEPYSALVAVDNSGLSI